jgi:nitrous oxide reductase accessory protein NosL
MKKDCLYLFSSMLLVMLLLAACSQSVDNAMPTTTNDQNQGGQEKIIIDHVTVSEDQVVVKGTSTQPDGDCVQTELIAGKVPLDWWPRDACGQVQQGDWELIVPLEEHQIDASVNYVIEAYLEGSDKVAAVLPFDTASPPQP